MINNVLELANDIDDYHSGEVQRYNGKHKIKSESVAEHSFMLALNIIKLCKIMEIEDNVRNEAVTLAILHDISEKYVGDMSYEFKSHPNHKSKLSNMLDKYEDMLYNEIYSEQVGETYSKLINSEDSVEIRLLKLGDSIACVQFSKREIELGNQTEQVHLIHSRGISRVEYDYNRLMEVL